MNASGQPRLIKKLNSAKTRIFNQDFLLALWELRPSELYAAGSATIARPNASGGVAVPDWNRVQKFVRDFINPSHGTVNSPFPIAGFWNTGGQDFVLPNEDAYKKALVSVIK